MNPYPPPPPYPPPGAAPGVAPGPQGSGAPKLFREPAKAEAVQCPVCGGPITLRGFGAIEQVACPYCGSELAPEQSGALEILAAVQRARQPSVLPLNARGTLDGVEWELIGIVWRQCVVDGISYPWQEFLLYNPYRGYRWLIYQMTDGHWGLGEPLPGAPKTLATHHKSVAFKRETFKHFQTSLAQVIYVEGEFPWQVHRGDQAVAHDYVAPPQGLSIEQQTTEDGTDVTFTRMRHIEPGQVWKAFGRPGSPPSTSGVGPLQPNPWLAGQPLLWISFLVLLVVWGACSWLYVQRRTNAVVLDRQDLTLAPFSQEIEIGKPGEETTVEVRFGAAPLSNAYAYAEVMLISQASEEAIGIGLTAEEWHGVEDGESWREADEAPSVIVGGVEGGKYLVQVVTEAGSQPGQPAPADLRLSLRVRQDVPLMRYVLLPLLVILSFPLLNFLLGRVFEGRRWSKSDYAPSG